MKFSLRRKAMKIHVRLFSRPKVHAAEPFPDTDYELKCPNCKTGADALKLDRCEPMCPYMEYHNGTACAKYEPMPEVEKE